MQLGYIGLGKMGIGMVERLLEHGQKVVVWNRSLGPVAQAQTAGAIAAETLEDMVEKLVAPRVIWLMLPAGDVTEQYFVQLLRVLEPGDTIIEGANSFYEDSIRRGKLAEERDIQFIDVGVSGGPGGAREGACLMIGGESGRAEEFAELWEAAAAPDSYRYFHSVGAGHFVKMVHNGIEYGMMQAIGEGFALMKQAPFQLDLVAAAEIYNNRSVIESRLIGWLLSGYQKHGPELNQISGSVKHSGEGAWTVKTAEKLGLAVPVIKESLQFRVDSTNNPSYTGQVVSVLRNEFGGHDVSHSSAGTPTTSASTTPATT